VQRDAEGALVYREDEIREFLPLLLAALLEASGTERTTQQTEAILGRYYANLGLKAGASDDEIREKMRAHYADKPLNPRLLSDFRAFLRAHAADLETPGNAETFLGFAAGVRAGPLESGPRPEGTIPAGPMAAFQASKKKDDES